MISPSKTLEWKCWHYNQFHNKSTSQSSCSEWNDEWSATRTSKPLISFLVFQVVKVGLEPRSGTWPGNDVIGTHFAFDLYRNLLSDNKSSPPPLVSAFRLLPPDNHDFQRMNNRLWMFFFSKHQIMFTAKHSTKLRFRRIRSLEYGSIQWNTGQHETMTQLTLKRSEWINFSRAITITTTPLEVHCVRPHSADRHPNQT